VSLGLTLGLYLARRFALAALGMLLALSALVSLFDVIELLRRAAQRPNVGLSLVLEIGALRLPFIALQILPFAILLGAIIAFWRLTRSSELVVVRSAGVSAWGFLAGPMLVALGLGVFATTALSPVAAMTFSRAERLENTHLRSGMGLSALAGGRLWLRQADRELDPGGVAILSGRPVTGAAREAFELRDVSLWRLSADDRPLERIEAPRARLEGGFWLLDDARRYAEDRTPRPAGELRLPSDLTPARIEGSFASPETLSFWALPEFIAVLEGAGFSALRHRLHFHSLLALPVLAAAMLLLAAGFSTRVARRGGVAQMIALGVASGFALFLLDRISGEFGEAGSLPVVLAAWAPAGVGLLASLGLLLHLEDG
jgi:lipopolysaccharide export system permease protein